MRKRPGVGDNLEGADSGEGGMQPDSGDGDLDSTTTDAILGSDMQPRAASYGDYGYPQMYPQKGPPPYIQAGQQMPAPYAQFPAQNPYFQPLAYPGQGPFLGPQYSPIGPQQQPINKQEEDLSETPVTPKSGKKKKKGKKTGECSLSLVFLPFLAFKISEFLVDFFVYNDSFKRFTFPS